MKFGILGFWSMGNLIIDGARTKDGSKCIKMAAISKMAAKNINVTYTDN